MTYTQLQQVLEVIDALGNITFVLVIIAIVLAVQTVLMAYAIDKWRDG